MVVFLTGLVSLILYRTLKTDISKHKADNLDEDPLEDLGWKQLRGDVFRKPPHLLLLSSLVGTGYHLGWSFVSSVIIASLADLYEE